MRMLALVIAVLVPGCLDEDRYEPPYEPPPSEPAAAALSLVDAHCSYSFGSGQAGWLQVRAEFDVTLPVYQTYEVDYVLPHAPSYQLFVDHGCGEWERLPATDGTTVGCYREMGPPVQVLNTHLSSVSSTTAPRIDGMQITVIARVSHRDAVMVLNERTIACERY